jgi:hypothetical protein
MKEYLHEANLHAYLYSVTPDMREAAGIRARVAPLFTTLSTLKTPTKLAKTPSRYLLRTTTVQHGLNLNPCYFATVSHIQHRTHHGAPAIATRKHAPIWAQATLEAAGNAVECWKDIGRDKSERHQCAQCTRRSHATSNVNDQTQTEQL